MKLLFIIGNSAVGKMTVGQELMKITELKLFHNHMVIEPVIDVFGTYDHDVVEDIRDIIFQRFAASDNYGMIFTYLWAFDQQEDWDYVEHIKSIFEPYGTEFYCAELIAPQEIRLARNITENRLANKKSKRNIEVSNARLINDDKRFRCVSYEGEVPFENYLRIDNTDLTAEETARQIKERFGL